jgi:hypothetical protein
MITIMIIIATTTTAFTEGNTLRHTCIHNYMLQTCYLQCSFLNKKINWGKYKLFKKWLNGNHSVNIIIIYSKHICNIHIINYINI